MTFTKIVKVFLSLFLHIAALGVIMWALWPIVSWYLNHRPILGVDFYNTATFARYFKNNFDFLPRSYLDFWYAGSPIDGYLVMNWYKVYALVSGLLPLLTAIKYTSIFSFGLLICFAYLGAYRLSKNHFLSALISLLIIYSPNMYGSLTWGGSLPYFANQLFLPAVLWLMASYLDTGNKRWYWLSILILGVAISGHIGNGGAFMLPMALILLLFGKRVVATSIWKRIKEVGVFLLLLSLIIYKYLTWFWGVLFGTLGTVFQGLPLLNPSKTNTAFFSQTVSDTGRAITEYIWDRFFTLFTDTNKLFYLLLGAVFILFILAVITGKNRRNALGVIAWFFLFVYAIAHVYVNARGISFVSQGWYRAFWHFPVVTGFFIASLAGFTYGALAARSKLLGAGVYAVLALVAGIISIWLFINQATEQTISTIEHDSSISSAYPQVLDLVRSEEELRQLKLYPTWMDVRDQNYRLYTSDAEVNVWWNALYDLPLVRGYLDPPGNISQHFLLAQAIGGDGLVKNYKYPEEIAKNMALYYIDWYAIRYAEGGHLSHSDNHPPSSYLKEAIADETTVETKGVYFLYQTESGKPEVYEDVPQYLYFYRFADEITSPIVTLSNAPTLLCLCDYPAYESLIKILSMHNLNSRSLVTAYWSEAVDRLTKKDLASFDLLVMSNYRYQNRLRAHELLKDYLKSGGKVFIDTGGETPDSQSNALPEWLPFSETKRKGLGNEWNFQKNQENEIVKNFDFTGFSPPVFDNNEWNLSYPVGKMDDQASVLLSQMDKPILISSTYGGGKVVWSGMNLGYHVQYYTNVEESKLYVNILKTMLPLSFKEYTATQTDFINAGSLKVQASEGGRGVLIKQQMYPAWKFTLNGRNVKGYTSGPSHPGFIYIPLGGEKSVDLSVAYIGEPRRYMETGISWFVGLLLIDLSLFGGHFISKRLEFVKQFIKKRTSRWWEKEE